MSARHRRITGKLVIATHNPGKLREMRDLLGAYGIEAVSAGELGLAEPEETGASFAENARIKAKAAAQAAAMPAFADDSGLVVDALGGAPGIHSARWAGPDKDFGRAMEAIDAMLRDHGALRRRSAARISSRRLCVAWPDGHVEEFEATVDGTLVFPPRGDARLRLRPDLPARRARPDLRRNVGARRNTDCRRVARAVAPGARLRQARGGLPVMRRTRCSMHAILHPPDKCDRPGTMTAIAANATFGVYVHWPFCLSKCPYCDFNSHVRHGGIDEARFLRAFETEIAATAARVPGREVSTIFFGGGTPSLMQPATVAAILEAIARHWPVAADVEVTLEANPTSVEAERFRGYPRRRRQSRLARRAGARRRARSRSSAACNRRRKRSTPSPSRARSSIAIRSI